MGKINHRSKAYNQREGTVVPNPRQGKARYEREEKFKMREVDRPPRDLGDAVVQRRPIAPPYCSVSKREGAGRRVLQTEHYALTILVTSYFGVLNGKLLRDVPFLDLVLWYKIRYSPARHVRPKKKDGVAMPILYPWIVRNSMTGKEGTLCVNPFKLVRDFHRYYLTPPNPSALRKEHVLQEYVRKVRDFSVIVDEVNHRKRKETVVGCLPLSRSRPKVECGYFLPDVKIFHVSDMHRPHWNHKTPEEWLDNTHVVASALNGNNGEATNTDDVQRSKRGATGSVSSENSDTPVKASGGGTKDKAVLNAEHKRAHKEAQSRKMFKKPVPEKIVPQEGTAKRPNVLMAAKRRMLSKMREKSQEIERPKVEIGVRETQISFGDFTPTIIRQNGDVYSLDHNGIPDAILSFGTGYILEDGEIEEGEIVDDLEETQRDSIHTYETKSNVDDRSIVVDIVEECVPPISHEEYEPLSYFDVLEWMARNCENDYNCDTMDFYSSSMRYVMFDETLVPELSCWRDVPEIPDDDQTGHDVWRDAPDKYDIILSDLDSWNRRPYALALDLWNKSFVPDSNNQEPESDPDDSTDHSQNERFYVRIPTLRPMPTWWERFCNALRHYVRFPWDPKFKNVVGDFVLNDPGHGRDAGVDGETLEDTTHYQEEHNNALQLVGLSGTYNGVVHVDLVRDLVTDYPAANITQSSIKRIMWSAASWNKKEGEPLSQRELTNSVNYAIAQILVNTERVEGNFRNGKYSLKTRKW